MKQYATFGDVLSHAFAEKREKDDNGNTIEATGEQISEEEYTQHKEEVLKRKLSRFRIRK